MTSRRRLARKQRQGYEPLDVPHGYCHCGCGGKTSIAKENLPRLGHVKGEPVRYIAGHHSKRTDPEYAVDAETGCWIWQRSRLNRYGHSWEGGAFKLAHIAMYEKHVGKVPTGFELDHRCRNTHCVNPAHMEVVTHAENVRRGASAKLTPDQVRAIKEEPSTITHVEIAQRFNVTPQTIGYIRRGETWRNLNG